MAFTVSVSRQDHDARVYLTGVPSGTPVTITRTSTLRPPVTIQHVSSTSSTHSVTDETLPLPGEFVTYDVLVVDAENMSTNPSLETGINGWSGGTSAGRVSLQTYPAYAGAFMRRWRPSANTTSATTHTVPNLVVGRHYYVSVYVNAMDGPTPFTLSVAGTTVAGLTVQPSQGWVKLAATFTAASTSAAIAIGASSGATATYAAVDALSVVEVPSASSGDPVGYYFDGDTPPVDGYVHAWTGPAHASRSIRTETRKASTEWPGDTPTAYLVDGTTWRPVLLVLSAPLRTELNVDIHQGYTGGVLPTRRAAGPWHGPLSLLFKSAGDAEAVAERYRIGADLVLRVAGPDVPAHLDGFKHFAAGALTLDAFGDTVPAPWTLTFDAWEV